MLQPPFTRQLIYGIPVPNFVTNRQKVQSVLLDHSQTDCHGLQVRCSFLLTKECLNSIRMSAYKLSSLIVGHWGY